MSSLFHWRARPKVYKIASQPGDYRTRRKLLLLPKKLGNEWRWLGIEPVTQRAYMGWAFVPDGPLYQVLKWHDLYWEEDRD